MYYLVVGVVDCEQSDILKLCFDESLAMNQAQKELNKIYDTRFLEPRYEYELVKVLSFNSDGDCYNTDYYRRKE